MSDKSLETQDWHKFYLDLDLGFAELFLEHGIFLAKALLPAERRKIVMNAPKEYGVQIGEGFDESAFENYASAQLETDWENIKLALKLARKSQAWNLILRFGEWVMLSFLAPREYWDEWSEVGQLTLEAARRQDPESQVHHLGLVNMLFGDGYFQQGEWQSARTHYEEALPFLSSSEYDLHIVSRLAAIYSKFNKFEDAIKAYIKVKEDAFQKGDEYFEAWARREVALVYLEQSCQQEAEEECRQALLIFQKLENKREQIQTLRVLENIEREMGRIEDAKGSRKMALRLCREIGDNLQAHTLVLDNPSPDGFGPFIDEPETFERAVERATTDINLCKKSGDRYGEAQAWRGFALLYRDNDNNSEATTCHLHTLALARSLNNNRLVAETLYELAWDFFYQTRSTEALEHFSAAKAAYRELGDNAMVNSINLDMSLAYMQRGNNTASKSAAELGHMGGDLAPTESRIPDTLSEANTLMGTIFDKDGKPVEGAILEIRDQEGRPQTALITNREGRFFASQPLEDGKYLIVVDEHNLSFEPLEFTAKGDLIPPIVITAVNRVAFGEFTHEMSQGKPVHANTLLCKVVDAKCEDVSNAIVEVNDLEGRVWARMKTGVNGRCNIRVDLPDGAYLFETKKVGLIFSPVEFKARGTVLGEFVPIFELKPLVEIS